MHNWSKNITFKIASKLTETFNNYLWISEGIETFFITEMLISEEKERKIVLDFPENADKKDDNSFWTEIIHYVLTGKFQGFGRLEILYVLLIVSALFLVIVYFIF